MRKAVTTTAFVIGYVITNSLLPAPADSRVRLLPIRQQADLVEQVEQAEGFADIEVEEEIEIPEIGPETVLEPEVEPEVEPVVLRAAAPVHRAERRPPSNESAFASDTEIKTKVEGEPTLEASPSVEVEAEPELGQAPVAEPELQEEPSSEASSDEVDSSHDVNGLSNLGRFYKALRDLEAGRRQKVHVVHYGDSEIAGDGVTRTLREIWGKRFGFGGPGFSLAARPFPTYHRDGFRHRKPLGFLTIPYTRKAADGSPFGPGGVLFETWGKGAQATVNLTDPPTSGGCTVGFYYVGRNRGGTLELSDGKNAFATVNTSQGTKGVRRFEKYLNQCPKRLRVVSTRAGRTQIYGWSVSYDQPGILWSSMGVLSAQLSYLNRYQEGNFGASIKALTPTPDLLVLAYGLNIGSWSNIPGPNYKNRISEAVSKVRKEAGSVDCLMMGPYPIGRFKAGRVVTSPAALAANRIQSEVAAELGCSYLDRIELAGGPSATRRWLNQKPKRLSSDYVHMTFAGSRAMADDITQVLLRRYEGPSVVNKSVPAGDTD